MEVFSYPSSSEPYASVTLGFFMLKFVFTSHSCHSYSTESALPTLKLDGLWESIEVVWWDRTRFSGLPRLKEFSFILNVLPALTTLYLAFPSYLIYKIPLYPLSSWCKTLFRQGNTVVIWTGSRRSFAQPLTRPLHLSSIIVACVCIYLTVYKLWNFTLQGHYYSKQSHSASEFINCLININKAAMIVERCTGAVRGCVNAWRILAPFTRLFVHPMMLVVIQFPAPFVLSPILWWNSLYS